MAYCIIELTIGAGDRFSIRRLVVANAGPRDIGEVGLALKRAAGASHAFTLQVWDNAPTADLRIAQGTHAIIEGVTAEQVGAGDLTDARLKSGPDAI